MAKNITLLLLTRNVLARVDLRVGQRANVRKLWLRERFDSESTGTLVDATYRLGPKSSAPVWVLSGDFWSGVVEVPRDILRMASEEEVADTVAVEAETYSGISPFDSRVSMVPLSSATDEDSAAYWCAQVSNADISDIKLALEGLKAKFGGVATPSLTLPAGQQPANETRWLFTQSIGDQTHCSLGAGSLALTMTSLVGTLDSARTIAEWQSWLDDQSVTEDSVRQIWLGDSAPPEFIADTPNVQFIRLDEEAGLKAWATAIAPALLPGRSDVPKVATEKTPLSNEAATATALGLGMLAMAGCAGYHWMVSQQIGDAKEEIARLEKRSDQVTSEEKALAEVKKNLTEIEQKLTQTKADNTQLSQSIASAQSRYLHLRQRWIELLKALKDQATDECWVREISGDASEATFVGMATSAVKATRFSRDLELSIRGKGWQVSPAVSSPTEQGLVEFSIQLSALNDADLPLSQAGAAGEFALQNLFESWGFGDDAE